MVKATIYRSALIAMALAAQASVAMGDGSAEYSHAPSYTSDGRLNPPADYREWVFLSSGLDMSYNEKAMASSQPVFDNVFVNPEAYRAFLKTGTWPDKTQFVLEVRSSSAKGSINHRGHFQSGAITGMEVHVKDTSRFQGGWAFFGIDGQSPAKQIPLTQACYSCHSAHGAVDTTFVQFYPTLLPIAQQHVTLSTAYMKDEAQAANTVH